MKRMTCMLATAALTFAIPASAQDRGFYVGGAIGQTRVDINSSELAAALTASRIGNTGVTADEKDTGWKALIGYRVNRWLGIEGAYVNLGEFTARTTVTSVNGIAVVPTAFDVNVEAQDTFSASLLGHVPVGDRFELFGRLGFYTAKTELSIPRASFTQSDRDSELLYGFGAGFHISRNVTLRAEWERYTDVGDASKTGESDVDMISIGLIYRF